MMASNPVRRPDDEGCVVRRRWHRLWLAAVMCAVSAQSLTRPLDVFREVRRVLRPSAPFVVSFSNRCFPDKAVALWHVSDDQQHVDVVTTYFTDSAEPGRNWGAGNLRAQAAAG